MAAILATEGGAVLSHRSAGALWGIAAEWGGVVEISVRTRRRHRVPGIRCRERPSLPSRDLTDHLGIPVTTPARALLDIAGEVGPRTLERAVNDADELDLVDPEALRGVIAERPGEPGVGPLRALLDPLDFLLSDSELEVLFRPLAAAAGLPQPLTKQRLNGFECDFHWPGLGLVVETDGLRYHRTASTQRRDALRDQIHTAAGLTTLRFTHWQVKYECEHVIAVLTPTAARLLKN